MPFDVAKVRAHIARLREELPDDPTWWMVGPRWDENRLRAFEDTYFTLPSNYRTWLAEIGDGGASWLSALNCDGMVPLATRTPDQLASAKRVFRIRSGAKHVTYPVSGVLPLAWTERDAVISLVVSGKHMGTVFADSTRSGGTFEHCGTFDELVVTWLEAGVEAARAAHDARIEELARFAALAPHERPSWDKLCSDFVRWLRIGPTPFVETFARLERRPHDSAIGRGNEIAHLVIRIETQGERLVGDVTLGRTAAIVLGAVLDIANTPTQPVACAVVAILDDHPFDLEPGKLAAAIAAVEESPMEFDARQLLGYVEAELLRAGRWDDAIAMFRLQHHFSIADHGRLARALIKNGHGEDAIALIDELPAFNKHELERARERNEIEVARDWVRRAVVDPTVEPTFQVFDEMKRIAPTWRRTHNYELVALLFGLAGDGEHMIDAAVRALAIEGVRRRPVEHANHVAHMRIGEVLAGRSPSTLPDLEINYLADYVTQYNVPNATRRQFVQRILAQLPSIGITVR